MNSYIDIQVYPATEIPAHSVLATLYDRLHGALVQLRRTDIAVAFPEYSLKPRSVGNTIRIISAVDALQMLMAIPWINSLKDYVSIDVQKSIPSNAPHRRFTRVQVKSSPERLRRRFLQRHPQTSPEEACNRFPDNAAMKLELPFIQLYSASTGQQYPLFLRLGAKEPMAMHGEFNSYGLSQTATIPWF